MPQFQWHVRHKRAAGRNKRVAICDLCSKREPMRGSATVLRHPAALFRCVRDAKNGKMLNTAVWLVDRLRDMALSHHRALVVEVSYMALTTGVASGAERRQVARWSVSLLADRVGAAARGAPARREGDPLNSARWRMR